jgi:hypothetical protein
VSGGNTHTTKEEAIDIFTSGVSNMLGGICYKGVQITLSYQLHVNFVQNVF